MMRYHRVTHRALAVASTWLLAAMLLCALSESYAQGTKTLHRLQLVHPGVPTAGITLQPPASVPTYTLNLPATAPTGGQILTSNGTNGLSWGSAGASFSGITSSTASNTIDNGNNALTWSWSGSSSNNAVLSLFAPAPVTPALTGLRLSLTGANATASQTTTTLAVSNTRTGTNSTNYGLWIYGSEVLGPGNTSEDNPALTVVNGLSGFGTTAPTAIVQIGAGTSTANAGAPLKLHNGRANVSLDSYTATNDYKAGEMTYWDTVFVSSVANDMMGTMPSTMFRCANDSATNVAHSSTTWYNLFRSGTPPNVTSVNPTITLPKGTYEFEILFLITTDWKFGFGFLEGAGSTVEYSWMATGWQGGQSTVGNSNVVTLNVAATNTEIIPTGGSQYTQVFIRGILRVTSTTADLTPQIYINTSSNSDNVYRNNYMKISCLGADNVKRRGKWE
ncbi:MAG: hypothetical protein FGM24_09310 [Candidatus Kapabacteria bacterium]|nr:hypothetical protein [Candidatus Kapabacteria bacterium]